MYKITQDKINQLSSLARSIESLDDRANLQEALQQAKGKVSGGESEDFYIGFASALDLAVGFLNLSKSENMATIISILSLVEALAAREAQNAGLTKSE